LTSLKNLLKEVKGELSSKEKIRETAQTDLRRATSLSKQAILLIHQKREKEAVKLIEKARKIILDLGKTSQEFPEIIHGGLLDAARQEYSEANIFLKLSTRNEFVTPKEIGVPSVDYVLGLADVIGEYRRLVLDALREGNLKRSEQGLKTMDDIYVELMALDEAYMLVPGLRRKCDIARRIIETTRGDVTQEARKNSLEQSLKHFEKLVQKKRVQT
jgi:translin